MFCYVAFFAEGKWDNGRMLPSKQDYLKKKKLIRGWRVNTNQVSNPEANFRPVLHLEKSSSVHQPADLSCNSIIKSPLFF